MTQGRSGTPRGSGPRGGRSRPLRRTPARPGEHVGRSAGRGTGRAAEATRRRRPRLTSRAAILVLVVAALAVSYASSLRAYLEQRHHISSLRESIADSEQTIAELEREKRRWKDDAYVISQARARFAFGFPGEIGYQVLDENGKPLGHEDSLSEPRTLEDPEPEWWQTTLESIEVAGNPPAEAKAPAGKITAPAAPKSER